jgi:hypothetical protein
MLIAGFAILFSSFTTQTLGAIICLTLYVIGHLSEDLKYFTSGKFNFSFRTLAKFVYNILPNLEKLNLKAQATYGIASEWSDILFCITLRAFYILRPFLALTIIIFSKRDLK